MLTRIHLQNFKGIKERQTIELKPITLLFGANSSGKSTVIQALHYAREIFERFNFNADKTMHGGEVIDLGGFENMVYKHDKTLPINMQFDLDMTKNDLPDYIDSEDYYYSNIQELWLENEEKKFQVEINKNFNENMKSISISIYIEWKEEIKTPLITLYQIDINNVKMLNIKLESILANGKSKYCLSDISFGHPIFNRGAIEYEGNIIDVSNFFIWALPLFDIERLRDEKFSIPLHQSTAIPTMGKYYHFEESVYSKLEDEEDLYDRIHFEKFLSMLITGPCDLLRNQLDNFRYIGPIRTIPQRTFKPFETENESRWSDGMAAWDLLYKKGEKYIQESNDWLFDDKKFDTGYKLKVKESREWPLDDPVLLKLMQGTLLEEDINLQNYIKKIPVIRRLRLIDQLADVELSPKDVGVGISQLLPVLVGCIAQRDSILAVEQPELHMHPRMQLVIADLLISQINKKEKEDTIYLFETHSEHLILRLLRRIEETAEDNQPQKQLQLTPDQLSVNIFTSDVEGIHIMQNPVDNTGEFEKFWPQGFFEERDKELLG